MAQRQCAPRWLPRVSRARPRIYLCAGFISPASTHLPWVNTSMRAGTGEEHLVTRCVQLLLARGPVFSIYLVDYKNWGNIFALIFMINVINVKRLTSSRFDITLSYPGMICNLILITTIAFLETQISRGLLALLFPIESFWAFISPYFIRAQNLKTGGICLKFSGTAMFDYIQYISLLDNWFLLKCTRMYTRWKNLLSF